MVERKEMAVDSQRLGEHVLTAMKTHATIEDM
jgi:hypothetical protein